MRTQQQFHETAKGKATEFLRSVLRDAPEPLPAASLQTLAYNFGFTDDDLRVAKRRLGVVARQRGRHWYWSMGKTGGSYTIPKWSDFDRERVKTGD